MLHPLTHHLVVVVVVADTDHLLQQQLHLLELGLHLDPQWLVVVQHSGTGGIIIISSLSNSKVKVASQAKSFTARCVQ